MPLRDARPGKSAWKLKRRRSAASRRPDLLPGRHVLSSPGLTCPGPVAGRRLNRCQVTAGLPGTARHLPLGGLLPTASTALSGLTYRATTKAALWACPRLQPGVASTDGGVQSGEQTERNRDQLSNTDIALARPTAPDRTGSLRLGAGRPQVQILSPRCEVPAKRVLPRNGATGGRVTGRNS